MPTITLYPTGSPIEQWAVHYVAPDSGGHWKAVDEPDPPEFAGRIQADNANDNDIDQFTFSPIITDVKKVISVECSCYGRNYAVALDPKVNIYLGSWLGQKTLDYTGQTWIEATQSWANLSGTASELSGIQFQIQAPVVGKNQWVQVGRIKLNITYEPLPTVKIGKRIDPRAQRFFSEVWDLTVGE